MSAALILRERNPDNDFVLHGAPPLYTDRKYFYPTNSDITTTTQNLSQHEYRADHYREIFEDDENLHSSLRNMSRSLRMVSSNIRKKLEEESTAKKYLQSQTGTAVSRDEWADLSPLQRKENRNWLSDSEWNTSSGHHVTFADNVPRAMRLNKDASMPLREALNQSCSDNDREAEQLWKTVNTDMDLAEVPVTRFTRKDLLASEYFPVTMSCSLLEGSKTPRRSRPRTRSPRRLAQSARMRAKTPERTPISDNFHNMKRLEKLYLVTAEAPAIYSFLTDDQTEATQADALDDVDSVDSGCCAVQNLRATVELLVQVVIHNSASAPTAIASPYHEEIGRLRMERLKLEEDHLKELARLSTLERVRGPKPKWYELKDAQFHFEAGKNNDMLRSMQYWSSQSLKTRSQQLSQSHPDLFALRTRASSFS